MGWFRSGFLGATARRGARSEEEWLDRVSRELDPRMLAQAVLALREHLKAVGTATRTTSGTCEITCDAGGHVVLEVEGILLAAQAVAEAHHEAWDTPQLEAGRAAGYMQDAEVAIRVYLQWKADRKP